jgi:mRNA interferase MazF
MDIERGWFYLADLNPKRGTEPGKTRPVLVVQTDLLNRQGHSSTVIIPLTTNVQDNAQPLRVRVKAGSPGFSIASDLMIDQIRAIDNQRLYRQGKLIKKIARIETKLITEVEDCLKKILELR